MAFNLANLGAAINPLSALPGTLVKGIRSRALPIDFQSLLASSLASQIQNGAPMQSARTTLQRALTAALAPPGTSPPHPSTAGPPPPKPASAQLTAIIEKAGQQNEIPGTILDANPAKEPPAPQKKPVHQVLPDAADAFARSLAQQATLSQAAQTPGAPAPAAASAAAASPTASTTQQQALPNVAAPPAPDPFPFAPSNVSIPAPAVSANNDVLSRIVARAVNAGTQHAAAAPQPQQAKPSTTVATPAASFEKLAAAITAAAGSSSQSQTGSHGNDTPSQSNDSQSALTLGAPQAPSASPSSATVFAPKFAAPYTPVDPNAVIEQVVKGIVINSAGTSSQIRLRLQPEHLGEVAVKLTVSGNSISANVVAQSASVRDALMNAQPQLTRSLADAGLSLGSFSVNVSGGNAGSANERQQTQQNGAAFKIGGWNAAFTQNEEQPAMDVVTGPASSGPRAMVINSLA